MERVFIFACISLFALGVSCATGNEALKRAAKEFSKKAAA